MNPAGSKDINRKISHSQTRQQENLNKNARHNKRVGNNMVHDYKNKF